MAAATARAADWLQECFGDALVQVLREKAGLEETREEREEREKRERLRDEERTNRAIGLLDLRHGVRLVAGTDDSGDSGRPNFEPLALIWPGFGREVRSVRLWEDPCRPLCPLLLVSTSDTTTIWRLAGGERSSAEWLALLESDDTRQQPKIESEASEALGADPISEKRWREEDPHFTGGGALPRSNHFSAEWVSGANPAAPAIAVPCLPFVFEWGGEKGGGEGDGPEWRRTAPGRRRPLEFAGRRKARAWDDPAAISGDGSTRAVMSREGDILIWDLRPLGDGKLLWALRAKSERYADFRNRNSLWLSHDGSLLIVNGGTEDAIDTRTGQCVPRLGGGAAARAATGASSFLCSPDDVGIVVGPETLFVRDERTLVWREEEWGWRNHGCSLDPLASTVRLASHPDDGTLLCAARWYGNQLRFYPLRRSRRDRAAAADEDMFQVTLPIVGHSARMRSWAVAPRSGHVVVLIQDQLFLLERCGERAFRGTAAGAFPITANAIPRPALEFLNEDTLLLRSETGSEGGGGTGLRLWRVNGNSDALTKACGR